MDIQEQIAMLEMNYPEAVAAIKAQATYQFQPDSEELLRILNYGSLENYDAYHDEQDDEEYDPWECWDDDPDANLQEEQANHEAWMKQLSEDKELPGPDVNRQEYWDDQDPVYRILGLEQEILSCQPPRLSMSDIEDVSDNYQANLEYEWFVEEQEEVIRDLITKLSPTQLKEYNSRK